MPKCKICSEKFEPKFFLQKVCENIDCKVKFSMQEVARLKEKNAKEKKQAWTKEKIEIKKNLMSLSDWKNELQKEINAIIREIDRGHGCIATGSHNGLMSAGHYFSVGSNPTLRFHLENIWLQSMHSNSWKSGDTIRYQEGIISLYGKEYLDYLNSLQSIKTLQLTKKEIEEKIPIARGILKWLKLQNRKFTKEERLSLRIEFNKKIGIYENT